MVDGFAVNDKVVVTGEDAVLTAYDACNEVAFLVGIGHALTVDDGLSLCREVGPHGVEHVLNLSNLVHRDRCPGIAFDAAGTLARIQVTAELLCQYVRRDEYVAYLEDGRKSHFLSEKVNSE